jgi:GTPase SAR1 family protein
VGGKVRSLWTHYYDSLDALIFVVDSCDKEKLYIVKEEMMKLNKDLEFQNVAYA